MLRIAVHTLGCRTNQADSDEIIRALNRQVDSIKVTNWSKEADLYLLNTCVVTATAARKCRQKIGQIARMDPRPALVVCGCYSRFDLKELQSLPGVDLVIDSRSPAEIAQAILDLLEQLATCDSQIAPEPVAPISLVGPRRRARELVKVQEGCNGQCAYCIVPSVRGPARSRPLPSILESVRRLAENGCREVVLTGTNLGCWGDDLATGEDLCELILALLNSNPEIRLRMGSLEPSDKVSSLLELVSSRERLCNHLHLSIQHTQPDILERMNRPRGFEQLGPLLQDARGICLGADIIVGFPGESAQHFDALMKTISELPLAYLQVFAFSPRRGTSAARYGDQVPEAERTHRASLLKKLSQEILWPRFIRSLVSSRLQVVVERERRPDLFAGRSSEYATVLMEGHNLEYGSLVSAVVERTEGRHCIARIL